MQKFLRNFKVTHEIILIRVLYVTLAKDCGRIDAPLNGTKHGSQTTYPNKVTFYCDEGFDLKGPSLRECKSDGIWSGEETLCEGKTMFRRKKKALFHDCLFYDYNVLSPISFFLQQKTAALYKFLLMEL